MSASTGRGKERLIGGIHSVRNVLRHGADSITDVWVDSSRHDKRIKEILAELRRHRIPSRQVTKQQLSELAPDINHQGILIRASAPAATSEADLPAILQQVDGPLLLLVLDGVQDPHNLGACLRTADAAGVHAVIAPKDRSVGLTPVACKVASGAAERLPFIQVTNLARTLKLLADQFGVWIIGAAGEAQQSLYEVDLTTSTALVMGGEERGMRRLTREHCDQLVSLPMAGSVESLNVSVAAGVALYEVVRQRLGKVKQELTTDAHR
ncbi:MAG: 23S rRNA (guanosine(2251)-2'-O)-methyltransferase RlmB [Pseudomonadota bacterium]